MSKEPIIFHIPPRYQTKAAEKSDWKTKPMPKRNEKIFLNRSYTKEEIEKIKWGYIPEQMEDKWFIYWENNTLFFHRSWTGVCIYVIEFETDNKGSYIAKEAILNRNPSQYLEHDNEYDKKLIFYLIDELLLNKRGKFPVHNNQNTGINALKKWSIMGRDSIKNDPENKD